MKLWKKKKQAPQYNMRLVEQDLLDFRDRAKLYYDSFNELSQYLYKNFGIHGGDTMNFSDQELQALVTLSDIYTTIGQVTADYPIVRRFIRDLEDRNHTGWQP